MNDRVAIKPQNNYNIWDLVAQGFIDENDVSEKGIILNQEYIDCLASLNLTSISSNVDISNSRPRPRTANNRRSRPPIAPRPRSANTPRVQTTPRAPTRNNRLNSRVNLNTNTYTNTNTNTYTNTSLVSPRYLVSPPRPEERPRQQREETSIFRSVPRVTVSLSANEEKNDIKEEKKDEDNDKMQCVICLTNERKYIITPCNHFCLCGRCCNRIKAENKCPICRRMNIKIQKVFL